MSDLVRVAVVGTGQVGDQAADLTHSEADALVAKLGAGERERALLLRAGAHATLCRAARVVGAPGASDAPAAADVLRPTSPRLTEILHALLGATDPALLTEALERAARAKLRLAPELLPLALDQRLAARRALLKPLLGQRGEWLSRRRAEWSWALAAASTDAELPADCEQRWAEGTASERKALLALARRHAPELARKLVSDGWKQEKVEQRVAFLEILAAQLTPDDEPLLTGMLGDRSANVRVAAARLLWRLPESAVARRVRERAQALVLYSAASGFGKLRALVGATAAGTWSVQLPPEKFDAAWERDGIIETPPHGVGPRQWWLLQLISALPPDVWLPSPAEPRAALLDAARGHDYASVLLDGISSAALRFESAAWTAPLWDAWMSSDAESTLEEAPLVSFTARLPADQVEARALALLAQDKALTLLTHLPRPWPERVARAFLSGLRPAFAALLEHAALAIPIELLPASVELPESADSDYSARVYARALEHFQSVAALRRSIAQETAP